MKYIKLGLSGEKNVKDIQLSLDNPKYLQMVFYHFHIDYILSLPKWFLYFLSINHITRYIQGIKYLVVISYQTSEKFHTIETFLNDGFFESKEKWNLREDIQKKKMAWAWRDGSVG